MRKVLALVQRELGAYFSSPLAYVVLTAFLIYNGFWFWIIVMTCSSICLHWSVAGWTSVHLS